MSSYRVICIVMLVVGSGCSSAPPMQDGALTARVNKTFGVDVGHGITRYAKVVRATDVATGSIVYEWALFGSDKVPADTQLKFDLTCEDRFSVGADPEIRDMSIQLRLPSQSYLDIEEKFSFEVSRCFIRYVVWDANRHQVAGGNLDGELRRHR